MATQRFHDPVQTQTQTKHRSLQLRNYLMLLVTILAMPIGNVMLGKGMKHAGSLFIWPPVALLHTGLHVISSPFFWLGLGSLTTWFVSYMLVLSWADYSYVQPATSLGYGVTALLSWLILSEHVSPLEWVGIAIICLGVFVVGRTNPQTTERNGSSAELAKSGVREADAARAN